MLTLRNRSIGNGRATVKAVAAISSGNRIPGATSATTGISFVMIECYGDFTPTVLQRCKLRANGGKRITVFLDCVGKKSELRRLPALFVFWIVSDHLFGYVSRRYSRVVTRIVDSFPGLRGRGWPCGSLFCRSIGAPTSSISCATTAGVGREMKATAKQFDPLLWGF